MRYKDVITVLQGARANASPTDKSEYFTNLFKASKIAREYHIPDESLTKIFYGSRPFPQDVLPLFQEPEYFEDLCSIFEKTYVPYAYEDYLVSSLTDCINRSNALSDTSKKIMRSIYQEHNRKALAKFVCACFVVSNLYTVPGGTDERIRNSKDFSPAFTELLGAGLPGDITVNVRRFSGHTSCFLLLDGFHEVHILSTTRPADSDTFRQ
jgi:hypothetical protein